MSGETLRNLQMQWAGRDGQSRDVMYAMAPIPEADGTIGGAVCVAEDVTDKIRLERQLMQSQKMEAIGQLTGGVAHDFNNLLTVITGTIDTLRDGVADRPQLAALATMIDQAATRGADLTARMLAFARKQPLQPRDTDLNGLAADAIGLLRPALGAEIEIESVLAPDAWPCLIDPSQLTSALLNLAINARDAMPGGGKITLETANAVLDEAYAERKRRGDARPIRHGRDERHRHRHPGGDPRPGVRSLLHHQGSRQGNRPWPEHGVRIHQAVGRPHQDLQRGGTRDDHQDVSAAHPARGRGRAGRGAGPPARRE